VFPRLEYGSQGRIAGRLGHRLDSPVEERDFFLSRVLQTGSETHLASYLVDTRSTYPRDKVARTSAEQPEHSPPSSSEVKSEWSLNSTLPYVFMVCTWTALPVFVL